METRANFALIGGFTIGLVALTMLFAMWLAQAQFSRRNAEYDIVFEGPARGLGKGSEVRFNGIRVGEVVNFDLDKGAGNQKGSENRVVARVRLQSQWPVRSDSEARLEPIGLTGLNLIQISAGTPNGVLLKQELGQPRPRLFARQGALDEILADSESITANVGEAVAGAKELLTAQNIARVTKILENLETISADLATRQGVLQSSARAADEWRKSAQQFNETAAEIEKLSADARLRLNKLDEPIDRITANVDSATVRFNQAVGQVDQTLAIANAQTLPDLSLAAQDMRRLSSTLDRLAGEVERSPPFAAVATQKNTVKVRP
jgi:phospholipid/cholesterol/gamma-HCH transport system substrate-binding protein